MLKTSKIKVKSFRTDHAIKRIKIIMYALEYNNSFQ